jgi:hypothetical protein
MAIRIKRADIVISADVECVDCGLTVPSNWFHFTTEEITALDLYIALGNANAGSHFPVGWVSYGYGTYRCPNCKI